MNNRFDLAIFDWDGTLVDSTGMIVDNLRAAIAELGWPVLPDATLKGVIGISLKQIVPVLYPELPGDPEDLIQAYRARYVHAPMNPTYPGVIETLQQLKANGVQLAVATGKARRGLDAELRHNGWQDLFLITKSGEETASKPDSLMLEQIVAETEIPRERMVMIGDTTFDMEMAQRAGIARIGMTYGVHDAATLNAYHPLCCLDQFPNLLAQICG